jgi:two-component system nitrogen regulation response regulator NtrX
MAKTVLVVDDEEAIRKTLSGALTDEGYRVVTAADSATALEAVSRDHPEVVLLDVWMEGPSGERQQEGLDVLGKIKAMDPSAVVVIMSGHGNIETAVRATKLGAYDFLEKPLSLDKVLVTLQNSFHLRDLARENENLRSRVSRAKVMVGESPAMKQLTQVVRKVAPTNSWVLITGENGTGKELVAHTIHALSSRYGKPLIEVNCAAIPEELIESELFGHERGSFTGASQMKRGRFEVADGGTLFLDEIGDMSLKTQAKILRILQEQRFERVGGSQTIEVDVRVIAATNKDLEDEIRKGTFRQDLYHRLNVIPLRVAPLRQRPEDITLIALHYIKEYATDPDNPKHLSAGAIEALGTYSWPGNVRELKNFIQRLVIMSDGPEIDGDNVMALLPANREETLIPVPSAAAVSIGPGGEVSLKDARTEFEKDFILRKLKENDWNISRTAHALGIERSNLHKKIKAYGIEDRIEGGLKS